MSLSEEKHESPEIVDTPKVNTFDGDIDLSAIRKKRFRIDGDNNRFIELNTSDMNILQPESMIQLTALAPSHTERSLISHGFFFPSALSARSGAVGFFPPNAAASSSPLISPDSSSRSRWTMSAGIR